MIVNVTQDDINHANNVQGDATANPTLHALLRMGLTRGGKPPERITLGFPVTVWFDDLKDFTRLPDEVNRHEKHWDNTGQMTPYGFHLHDIQFD